MQKLIRRYCFSVCCLLQCWPYISFGLKLPLAALCCMVFLVFVVERLIHTYYVFTDEGCLFIHQGRFSKVSRHSLSDIEKVDIVRPSSLSFLKNKDTVMLTFYDGSIKFITPFPAEDFCGISNENRKIFLKRQMAYEYEAF